MRKAFVVSLLAACVVVAQVLPALAWGGFLAPQDAPPLAGETMRLDVTADMGGKLGRDPSQLRVTNMCWPAPTGPIFVTQRSTISWTVIAGTHAEGYVEFALTDPEWPAGTVSCEAYLWRTPYDSVSRSFAITQYLVR
jgi:hypothetical protein